MHLDDTIVAISTPPGRGGIGIVRLSGPASREIALPLLRLKHPLKPGHAIFGELIDEQSGERIDEVDERLGAQLGGVAAVDEHERRGPLPVLGRPARESPGEEVVRHDQLVAPDGEGGLDRAALIAAHATWVAYGLHREGRVDAEDAGTSYGDNNLVGLVGIIVGIGSGGPFAVAAAKALANNTELDARTIAEKSMVIAGEICIYTNANIFVFS